MKPTIASTADAVVPAEGRMGHREDRRDPRRRADTQGVPGETSREAVAETTTARALDAGGCGQGLYLAVRLSSWGRPQRDRGP